MRSLLLVLLCPFWAWSATPTFRQFLWKADREVEITIKSTQGSQTVKGPLADNGTLSVVSGGLAVSAYSYTNSFVVIEFAEISNSEMQLVILERQNGLYHPITSELSGPPITLHDDFQTSISHLMKTRKWDAAIAIRSFIDFMNEVPGRSVHEFRTQVVGELVTKLPEPVSRRSVKGRVVRVENDRAFEQTKRNAERRSAAQNEEPKKTRAEEPNEPNPEKPRKRRVVRDPQPYEPRFNGYSSNYPGQNIGRRRSRPSFLNDLYR